MKTLFTQITALSLRFKWITVILTLAIIVGGILSFTSLNQELLPDIAFPQTFVVVRNAGASSDQILTMYAQPIEEYTSDIDNVVNVETVSNNGFGFATILNEFGTDQDRVVDDIQDALDQIPLPVRTLVPPDGNSARDLISELSPEAVLWLYNWAEANNSGFITQLNDDAISAFSSEALSALPAEAFTELDSDTLGMIQIDGQTETSLPQSFDPSEVDPPSLPESWQSDPRFATVEDLVELTTIRNLATVFNDFVEDNRLVGSLGKTNDLTVQDIELYLQIEEQCRTLDRPETDGDPCSFLSELDAATILALSPDIIAALPDSYLCCISPIERNEVAAVRAAEALSGETYETEPVLLPDSWRVEAPTILTFNFSDIPVGVVTINSATLSSDELKDFVENDLTLRLKEADLVADVVVEGGESIPVPLQNEARESIGLPSVSIPSTEDVETTDETDEQEAPIDNASSESETSTDEASQQQTGEGETEFPEGPALPPIWGAAAAFIGTDEFDTADDILKVVGSEVAGEVVTSAAEFINSLALQPTAAPMLDTLNQEILDYLAENEDGFYDTLDPEILAKVTGTQSPSLGENWAQLSNQPLLANQPLNTVEDILKAGAVQTISTIIQTTSTSGLETYAIRLMSDISPEALAAIVEAEPNFLDELAAASPNALRYFSRDTLESEAVADFLAETDDSSLASDLQAIIDGAPSAAEANLQGEENQERFVDPDAPALPPSWAGVAPFVGASELDTADDMFNVPGYSGAADMVSRFAVSQEGQNLVRDLTQENWLYLAATEPSFWDNINAPALRLINQDTIDITTFPQNIQARIAAGGDPYTPEESVTRTDANPSLLISIFKEDGANTVVAWDNVREILDEVEGENNAIAISEVFEQATFITTSLEGVQREGTTGAIFAIFTILLFMNVSFRSTAVISISIPGSVFFAFLMIYFIPANVNDLLSPIVHDANSESTFGSVMTVLLRLFPATFTLNIMTLSGLTVAIGRVVDDSIVVLENCYRNIGLLPSGNVSPEAKREAILNGTREVNVAIFAATLTTMVVFLPLGLFGGVVGAFFLPFGLAVTYALIGSYIMSITIVPVLVSMFISREDMPAEEGVEITPEMSLPIRIWAYTVNIFVGGVRWLSNIYGTAIRWALEGWHRAVVVALALLSLFFGLYLMGLRPVQFLPSLGEPTATISVNLPSQIDGQPVTIANTNARVQLLENWLLEQRANGVAIKNVQVTVGTSGNFDFAPNSSISETAAGITVVFESQEALDEFVPQIREYAEPIFNDLNNNGVLDYEEDADESAVVRSNVTVSGAAQDGGFGGFALVLQGKEGAEQPTLSELAVYNETVLTTLNQVEGLVNVELESDFGLGNTTYVRIDGIPALRYTGEIESDDTIGVTQIAIEDVQAAIDNLYASRDDLTIPVEISQGYESEQQEEGITEIFASMGIATVIAYVLLVLTFISFKSPFEIITGFILPFEILISLPLSIVGAAAALTVTDRVLGLPAMVGLLMLIGIVVTNAIVFLDRVQQNRLEKQMNTHDSLIEAGETRLRPILMTAGTTMIAQLPLAASTESGAIIAAELGTVVIGGLISSTVLTLLVLPVVHSLINSAMRGIAGMFGRK